MAETLAIGHIFQENYISNSKLCTLILVYSDSSTSLISAGTEGILLSIYSTSHRRGAESSSSTGV